MAKNKSNISTRAQREKMRSRQQRQRRLYYIIAAVGAAVIIGSFAVIRQLTAPSLEEVIVLDNLQAPANADGKAWGPLDAPVVFEEFSDFQCPFCRQFATGTGRQLHETYADSGLIRFEYNHFTFLGSESILAAEAAECANEQGQFWPYHDLIFANQRGENQGAFNNEVFRFLAGALELDETAFDNCLGSRRYRSDVQNETEAARQREVQSTPTLFINGEKIEGALPFNQIQALIEAELSK